LQTAALPLGYAAKKMERETGFEPATSTLARLHSTTELFPLTFTNHKSQLQIHTLTDRKDLPGAD
jgi:hypothetical protein